MQTFDSETGIASVVGQKFSINKRSPLPNLSMTMGRPRWKKSARLLEFRGRLFTECEAESGLRFLKVWKAIEADRIWVSRPRCLETLIESDSSGVCILKITTHPQTLINTGSEGCFCFREYSLWGSEQKIYPRKIKKISGTFF